LVQKHFGQTSTRQLFLGQFPEHRNHASCYNTHHRVGIAKPQSLT